VFTFQLDERSGLFMANIFLTANLKKKVFFTL